MENENKNLCDECGRVGGHDPICSAGDGSDTGAEVLKEEIATTLPHISRFAHEAGMTYAGMSEDGKFEFIGTETQWRRFRELVYNDEIAYA